MKKEKKVKKEKIDLDEIKREGDWRPAQVTCVQHLLLHAN